MAAFREEFDRVPEQYGREAGLRAAKSESRRGVERRLPGSRRRGWGIGTTFPQRALRVLVQAGRVATGRILTAECAPRSNP